MEKDIYYADLFEIYKDLLTEKQREIFVSHNLLDLSYAEIAEMEGTSRQSIYDVINIVKEKLTDFERALKIKEKNDQILTLVEKEGSSDLKNQVKEIIGK